MLSYGISIFLSAFLLFQVQPVIAKMILPWFGGSSSVWNTCMLFFQTLLLGGYLYAHWLNEKLSPKRQAVVHSALLALSLAMLPILPNPAWKPQGPENPSLRILGLLAVSVGAPYFLLSSTSPLLQAWYARTHRGAVPFRLFALSNLASMLALLSYPVAFEPVFTARVQGWMWSAGYMLFAAVCAYTAWRSSGFTTEAAASTVADEAAPIPPSAGTRFLWFSLAACASVLLLSVTTFLTQDVAAIPFLWILPLAAYLLTFILCFEAPWTYRRVLFLPLLAAALYFLGYRISNSVPGKWLIENVLLITAALFVCCMVCHGEMVRRKPHPRFLTGFYVMVSLGGAAGGLFVGLLAPQWFNAYYEFPLGLALCAFLAALLLLWDSLAWFQGRRKLLLPILPAVLIAFGWYLASSIRDQVTGNLAISRNFYGQLRVDEVQDEDTGDYRRLLHGRINHGTQYLDANLRMTPASYFCPGTGIGIAMGTRQPNVPAKIGILGLGCGALLAYSRPGDTFRLYEINPLVLDMARSYFTYIKDSPSKTEVALGDGRLVLEGEPSQQFDLLVMDAFSGDSVPVHLITREAFVTYFRHLKPGGILAINISNRYLDLRPVMEANARYFNKVALDYSYDPPETEPRCSAAGWVLVVDPAMREGHPELFAKSEPYSMSPDFRPWTDDFSNMFQILHPLSSK